MYDVEKHSAVLENVAGFMRLDTYISNAASVQWHFSDSGLGTSSSEHNNPFAMPFTN